MPLMQKIGHFWVKMSNFNIFVYRVSIDCPGMLLGVHLGVHLDMWMVGWLKPWLLLSYATVYTANPVFKGHLNIPKKVSLHHRFLNMDKTQDTVLRKCPLITECPPIGVSLEDRLYLPYT